jgi:acyl phosphate:glycerol-3-phosphate acyltransferase
MVGAASAVVGAYLCGSLPTGVWLGRWAGVDVRHSGSGNIGATNVARTVGAAPALVTLIVDIAKGVVPTVLARWLLIDQRVVALVGLAAFFGHIFSVFLRFSGGKGVATGFGVFLGLAPLSAGMALLVFTVVAFSTRYVSAASMSAAATLPLACAAFGYPSATSSAAVVVAVVILMRHRENLSRLLNGEESKFRVRS